MKQRDTAHVRAIGGGEDDDAGVALKAVHLGQQLIDGLQPHAKIVYFNNQNSSRSLYAKVMLQSLQLEVRQSDVWGAISRHSRTKTTR